MWLHAAHLPATKHAALTAPIIIGVGAGVLARALLLQSISGPFPSYPHGRVNYLFLGLVAGILGALAPAALFTADYTAGVFLAIGLQQFHNVREMERNMLLSLEHAQLVPRGRAYIEGMAMMVETRNYLSMLAAMVACAVGLVLGPLAGAGAGTLAAVVFAALARGGRTVGAVAEVATAPVRAEDGRIAVDGIPVWAEPPPSAVAGVRHALGITLRPRDLEARLTLAQPGQRQALLHDLTAHLGTLEVPQEGGRAHPLLPRDAVDGGDGRLGILLYPRVRRPEVALGIVRRAPLLETLAHRWLRGRSPLAGAGGAESSGDRAGSGPAGT